MTIFHDTNQLPIAPPELLCEDAVFLAPPPPSWRNKTYYGRPWQDLLFAIGQVIFAATAAPLWLAGTHVPVITGIGTGSMLYAYTIAHVSYRNWLTVVLTSVTATMWVLIGLGIHP